MSMNNKRGRAIGLKIRKARSEIAPHLDAEEQLKSYCERGLPGRFGQTGTGGGSVAGREIIPLGM